MGEDDFQRRVCFGFADKVFERGFDTAWVVVAGGLGGVEVDGPVVGDAPIREGDPSGAVRGKLLGAVVKFADAAEAQCFGRFQLVDDIFVGINRRKADEAVGGGLHPIGNDLIVPAASEFVLPIPTEQNSLIDTVGIHFSEHRCGGTPILDGDFAGGRDEFGPVQFVVLLRPVTWVRHHFGRVAMGMAVDDSCVIHGDGRNN